MHRDPFEPFPPNANANGHAARPAAGASPQSSESPQLSASPGPSRTLKAPPFQGSCAPGMEGRVIPTPHAAIRSGKLALIRQAVAATPDALRLCDSHGDPPLHFAIRSGAPVAILACLLEQGARLDARNMRGETALHIAFGQRDAEPARLNWLLAHADRNGDGGSWLAAFVPDADGGYAYERGLGVQRQPKRGMEPVIANLQRHDGWYRAYLVNMAKAVTHGDRAQVKALLACEMPLDLAVQGGKTALMVAAEQGHEGVVDMLLLHADEHGMRQLNLGAADSGDTALMLAAFHGHVAVVERLLAASAATEVPSQCGDTALMAAAVGGHDGIVDRLLNAGAAVDTRNALGRTALMFAAVAGHRATVEVLLRHGAAVDAKDGEGRSALAFVALHAAALSAGLSPQERVGRMRIDRIGPIAEFGAPSTVSERCQDLLRGRSRHRDTAQALLHHGASVDSRDIRGATALMHAAANGHIEILAVLLGAGADWELRDHSGRTALAYATAAGNAHAARMLKTCQG